MKNYNTYLFEKQSEINKMKEDLLIDCSQFLKESKGKMFYRGVVRKLITDYEIWFPPKNRSPKDTDTKTHEEMNRLSEEKIGFKARNGVFTTMIIENAYLFAEDDTSKYDGDVYIFIPLDGYKYAYIPDIDDFTNHVSNYANFGMWQHWRMRLPEYQMMTIDELKNKYNEERNDFLEDLSDNYKKTDMVDAGDAELSFICEAYYLVNYKYKDIIENLSLSLQ